MAEIEDTDLKLIVEHIEKISSSFAKDPSIVSAREAFTNGLKDYEVTDDIKALRYAEFEMSMATLTFSKSVELASSFTTIKAQKEEIAQRTKLLKAQENTEKYRQQDLKASINVKNQTAIATFHNAKFEEVRKEIAIKSNQDNMYLKKTEHKVAELDAYAKDDDITISANQMSDVKNMISNIPVTKLSYTSSITVQPEKISTTIS